MPASITHELVAWEALGLLPEKTREQIFSAPSYYYLGAQGPDLFFFYKPFARGENLGRSLHRTGVKAWFSSMLAALCSFTGREFSRSLAYALGFCTHLAADAVFHPFVYRYLRRTDAPRFTHQEIENDWDVYFSEKLRGERATRYIHPFDLSAVAAEGTLYRFLSETAGRVGKELSPAPFRRMCKEYALYLRHIHARHGRVLRLVGLGKLYPRETPDPSYLGGRDFYDLSDGKGADIDELFSLAADGAATRVSVFLKAFNADTVLPDELFSIHMLTGKRIAR